MPNRYSTNKYIIYVDRTGVLSTLKHTQCKFRGSKIFGTMKSVLDMDSSSNWGLIKTLGQEAKGDNLGMSFLVCYKKNGTPVSILYKSIAGRYRPVRVADGPITVRYDL